MGNFFFSYDLNGKSPTHEQMDKHAATIPGAVMRVLETVWYANTTWTAKQVFDHVDRVLSDNDGLLVIDARDAVMRNLLVPPASVSSRWNAPVTPPPLPRPPLMRAAVPLPKRR